MSDYDQRQYKVLFDRINAFQRKSIGLKSLIADTDALMRSLQHAEKPWTDAFYAQWAFLEDVYARALDQGLNAVPSDQAALVDNAVEKMQELVLAVLKKSDE